MSKTLRQRWYATKTGNDAHPQALIIDEETGRNVAVVYDNKDMFLLAAAPELLEALEAAAERMELVSELLPVHNRAKGVSQSRHVKHLAGHLFQHAKIASRAIATARGL